MSKSFQDFVDSLDLKSPNMHMALEEAATRDYTDPIALAYQMSLLVSLEVLRQYHHWSETPDE